VARLAVRRHRRRRRAHLSEVDARAAEDRTDEAAYAGLGVRGFLTDRFLVQAEYRKFQVFTSRDENEEPDSWTVAFTYFF
jgi:hypothetical protein